MTKLRADRLIATDARRFERLGAFRRKSEIIENYPEDPGAHLAKLPLQGPLKIYVTGTLCRRRGLEQLLHAARAASREVRIISSGWLFDDFATEVFVKDALVEYRGIITARESLEMAAECDALFCFYEPITVHHQFASPNKIYDAMSVGRPVLINSETIVSQWVADNNVGFLCEYEDRLELAAILDRLFALRAEQPANAARIRARFEQGFSWDCVEARLFDIYLQPKAGSSHREPCFEADQESKRAA